MRARPARRAARIPTPSAEPLLERQLRAVRKACWYSMLPDEGTHSRTRRGRLERRGPPCYIGGPGRSSPLPLYEYECPQHGRFELIQKFSDKPLKKCPQCGKPVEKLVAAPAFQFKGTGWYVTDYANKGKDSRRDESKSETKSEAKSESKSSDTKGSDSKDSGKSKDAKDSKPTKKSA